MFFLSISSCNNTRVLFQVKSYSASNLSSESKQSPSPSTHSCLSLTFLTGSCGLSPETALHVSNRLKKVSFDKDDERPKAVITFLETTGFTKTHISKLISKCPRLLFSSVENTIEPKIKHLQGLGYSGFQVGEFIATKPYVMLYGLQTRIIPILEYVRSFVHTDDNVRIVLKRASFILSCDAISRMQPNIALLRSRGVPNSEIVHMIMTKPKVLMVQAKTMKGVVEMVESLDFKPETRMFTVAVMVMCSITKSWEAKFELFKSLGWSEEHIFESFKRQPRLFTSSEEKIKQGMDFYTKNLNWDVSVISKNPILLMFSLKTRVIPRLAIFKILVAKKMIKEDRKIRHILYLPERDFSRRYVFKYQNQLPGLLQIYNSRCKEEEEEGTGGKEA